MINKFKKYRGKGNMKTTLVIMAAGIGSRFGGGIKQLAPVGLNKKNKRYSEFLFQIHKKEIEKIVDPAVDNMRRKVTVSNGEFNTSQALFQQRISVQNVICLLLTSVVQ